MTRIHELVECTITEEDLLKAALVDLEENSKKYRTKRYREEHPEQVAVDIVTQAWYAVRNTYLEELTEAVWLRYEDKDKLARYAESIFVAAAKQYDDIARWEGPYCNFDCQNCSEGESCDPEYCKAHLGWVAAGVIAAVVFFWQEAKGILPFPDEPTEKRILAYYHSHPNLRVANGVYVSQPSLF